MKILNLFPAEQHGSANWVEFDALRNESPVTAQLSQVVLDEEEDLVQVIYVSERTVGLKIFFVHDVDCAFFILNQFVG